MFQGESVEILVLDEGLVELRFNRLGDSINKLDARTVDEFRQATERIARTPEVRGVLVTSAKDVFIVGADITEFAATFQKSVEAIERDVRSSNEMFNVFEDLAIPSVVAINGFALGGGLELAMLAPLRVMADTAQVGVPEVKLGLIPGFGGTARLTRMAGLQFAIEWVAQGKPAKAPAALAAGVVDEVTTPAALRERALALLRCAVRGEVAWQAVQSRKRSPLEISTPELTAIGDAARTQNALRQGKHQPAAAIGIEMMIEAARCDRAGALDLEAAAFARISKTQAASSLVQAFLNDQAFKKLYKQHARAGRKVKGSAVVGAGIMGGGIASTSALRGTPVRLKDISQSQLDLGITEAKKQVARQVRIGRLAQTAADAVVASIVPQLDEAGFDEVDCVIEAVVEDLAVKRKVLAALEGVVRSDTVIASNTSSLRIDDIALPLSRPQNFVGMHFFNPVPLMQLVEVIRGSKTGDVAISTAVGYAVAMGKTPVVVKDCAGFLVNRVLTPYCNAFIQLVAEGADFEAVDRVMEGFGWPMGPAYLQDVVGMDVSSHVSDVIAAGYPQRMKPIERNAVALMVAKGRFGQKSGAGFYRYENDPKGRPRKSSAPEANALVAGLQTDGTHDFGDAEIIERMMLPMLVEAAHALEEGVVGTAAELDMAMLLGVGFPPYAGGPLKYSDWLGLERVVELCKRHVHRGPQYAPTPRMREMAAAGERYYPV